MELELIMIAAAERKLVRELQERRAFSTSTAIPLDPGRRLRRRRLERLVRRGVVREARPGHYWLETSAWEASVARDRMLRLAALALLLAGAALWYVTQRG